MPLERFDPLDLWSPDLAFFRKWLGNANFDPATLAAGMTVAGGAASAMGTLAGGNFAKQAGQMQQTEANYEADQLDQNAAQAFASGQRQAQDTQQRTRLAISTAVARGGASGVDVGAGSPATNVGEIAQRGSYQSLMDMFNGESTATGLRNQAAGKRYTGEMDLIGGEEAKEASYFQAAGTLAGSAGQGLANYGKMKYPGSSGNQQL